MHTKTAPSVCEHGRVLFDFFIALKNALQRTCWSANTDVHQNTAGKSISGLLLP